MKPKGQGTYLGWDGYLAFREMTGSKFRLSSVAVNHDGTLTLKYIGDYETVDQLETAVKVRTASGVDK